MDFSLVSFGNDKFKLLSNMKDLEIEIKGVRYITQSQQELADIVHFSKLKVNKLISELVREGYLISCDIKHGKFSLTDAGNIVIKEMVKQRKENSEGLRGI